MYSCKDVGDEQILIYEVLLEDVVIVTIFDAVHWRWWKPSTGFGIAYKAAYHIDYQEEHGVTQQVYLTSKFARHCI